MRPLVAVAAAVIFLCLPAAARAEHEEERSYVNTLVGTDVVSWVTTPLVVGFFGLYLGGPVVHASHGHPVRAGVSLLLRVGLSVGGGMLAAANTDCHGSYEVCPAVSTIMGAAGGMMVAQVLDWSLVMRISDAVARAPRVVPAVTIGHGGATVGVVGSF